VCLLPSGNLQAQEEDASSYADSNYFLKDTNPRIRALLDNTERNHFNAELLLKRKKFGEKYTLADWKYTLKIFPNHPGALQAMGSNAILKNDLEMGVFYFERALGLYPQYAMTHAQYGSYLADIGRYDLAIARLKRAISMDSGLVSAHRWLAMAYRKSGRPELAREADERADQLAAGKKALGGSPKK
jgi:tetratricopeptide (TPR) repeat protein